MGSLGKGQVGIVLIVVFYLESAEVFDYSVCVPRVLHKRRHLF